MASPSCLGVTFVLYVPLTVRKGNTANSLQ